MTTTVRTRRARKLPWSTPVVIETTEPALRDPAGFAAFCEMSYALQLDYIATEQGRMLELEELRCAYGRGRTGHLADAYRERARAIGFHPLTQDEIQARLDQLRRMKAEAAALLEDNERTRAGFWFHCQRAA